MNKLKNYYAILGLSRAATPKEIKLAYYAISKEVHPDKGGDAEEFKEVSEAYKALSDVKVKEEYDKKSKFGAKYDEFTEIYDFEFNNDAKNYDKKQYEEWKTREELNILVYVDDSFDGSVDYERWVMCKKCDGCGKDNNSKIAIRDENGKIVKYFDSTDGCDHCEGTGKWGEDNCFFCGGAGKVGLKKCDSCNGEKRMLGKQKLSGIKMKKDDKDFRVDFMGNVSRDIPGKVGHLWLIRKKATE